MIKKSFVLLFYLLLTIINIFFSDKSGKAQNTFFRIEKSNTLNNPKSNKNQVAQVAQIYNPIPISENQVINDKLTVNDIPTGEGGFARDYYIFLEKGDQIAIDLTSDEFDTIVTLMSEDGITIAENDDAPDGSTNSLLFTRIVRSGKYIIRVRAFGQTGNGNFQLKVTRLKPIVP